MLSRDDAKKLYTVIESGVSAVVTRWRSRTTHSHIRTYPHLTRCSFGALTDL